MSGRFDKQMADLGLVLRTYLDRTKPISCIYGNVVSVDTATNTMQVNIGDQVTMKDISLSVAVGGNISLLSFPTVGSLVVLGFIQGMSEMAFPMLFSEVDRQEIRFNFESSDDLIEVDKDLISIKRGSSTLEIKNDLITLNGGALDGLVKINELTSKLNNLVTEVKAINTAIKAHTHICGGAGAPTTATTYTGADPSNFSKGDYENTKIKQ